MRNFVKIKRTNMLKTCLVTLKIFLVLSSFLLILQSFPYKACAALTTVAVDPPTLTVVVGDTFNVNINITSVTNLTCWEFKLYYLNVLKCTAVTEGSFLRTGGGTFFNKVITNDYNSTHGQLLAYCTLLGPSSVSGSGVLTTITFQATLRGNTELHLSTTSLGDEKIPPQPIPHTTTDGTVQVGGTMVRVDPANYKATIGDTFKVNITVLGVENLTCWEFKLYFKNTVLNCTSAAEGPFLKSGGSTFFTYSINNKYNSTHGFVLAGCSLLGSNVSVSGSGTMATITFKAANLGVTTLHLAGTLLGDTNIPPKPIPHTAIDGKVAVCAPFTQVSVSPGSLTGPPGWININDTFTVNLTVSGVTDLVYWQAGMSFNPTVLQCVDFLEGPFLQTGGNTIWQLGTIDNEAGLITPFGATLAAYEGVSGNGTLASMTFKVKDKGISSLILQNVILLDSGYNKIEPIILQNGYFELPSIVPKPPSAYFYYYPLTPYVNQTATFDASDSTPNGGTITSYEWDFGDSSQGYGMIINHTYANPGEYNVTLLVTDSENFTDSISKVVIVLSLLPGASIDAYTQRDGKGLNKSSDAFAPDELVIITAYYTYNAVPVAGKLIAFDLYSPNGAIIMSRVSQTDNNGLAYTAFLIPLTLVFGTYTLNATTLYAGQPVSDSLSFKIGWLVEILEVTPCNRHGVPKTQFAKGEPFYLKVKLQNIRFYSTKATLVATVLDEVQQPVIFGTNEFILPLNQTILLMNLGTIPNQAFVGSATAYVNALQRRDGSPYCPEVPAPFMIVPPRPNVAVIGLKAYPLEACVGQSVNVTFSVLNDYNKPQSFNVTVYANSTATQIVIITNLGPYVETNFTCIWDTYPFLPGNYLMAAQASTVPGEIDIDDNTYVDGVVHILPRTSPWHDVSVKAFTRKTVVSQEHFDLIDLSIQNQGDYTEVVNASIYANQTIIATLANITLNSGNATSIVLTWNTSGFSKGYYRIVAIAPPVPGETDTADNTFTSGWVVVTIPGDINGDFKVDIKDLVLVIKHFGSYPGSVKPWNPNADINCDNKVDIKDLVLVIKRFGEHYP